MTYIYDEPGNIDKSEFLRIIASGTVTQICDAVVRAAHFINDYEWLLQQYELLLEHPVLEVRGVTISCIGHLARLNEHAQRDELLNILRPLLTDSNLVGRVEDAIDDINTFL